MGELAADLPEPAAANRPSATQRVSDRDRETVVDHLRAATSDGCLTLDEFAERVGGAWVARTQGELVLLTEDLPSPTATSGSITSTSTPDAGPVSARRRRLVNIFGSARHAGAWTAEPQMTVVAVFGHSHVDLTTCRFDPGVDAIELRTFGMFAGVEVVVPAGAVVDAAGFVLFGGRQLRHNGPVAHAAPAMRVRVRSYGAFGGLIVRSPRRAP